MHQVAFKNAYSFTIGSFGHASFGCRSSSFLFFLCLLLVFITVMKVYSQTYQRLAVTYKFT